MATQAQSKSQNSPRNIGIAIVALVVLAIVLFALAPHVTPSFTSVTFYIELIILAQLGAIAYWLAAKREV